jgi:hypothetical protein
MRDLIGLVLWHLHALMAFFSTRLAIKTNAGQDFQYNVMANSASNGTGAYAPANYIALTSNATAPNVTDTALAAEATGALARVIASTISHTTGTNTYQLQKTFTSDQSLTVNKIGIFNAAAVGTMVFETTITAATLVSGDQLQITETVTM